MAGFQPLADGLNHEFHGFKDKMDSLATFTNDELKQVFEVTPESDAVKNLIEQEYNAAGSRDFSALHVIRDEAFGVYWKRRLEGVDSVSEEGFLEVLNWRSEFQSVGCILGELAISKILSDSQCREILNSFSEKEWAWKQAKVALLSERVIEKRKERGRRLEWEEIETEALGIIKYNQIKSFSSIFEYLSDDCLESLFSVVETEDSIPKKFKNVFKGEVQKQLKGWKNKS